MIPLESGQADLQRLLLTTATEQPADGRFSAAFNCPDKDGKTVQKVLDVLFLDLRLFQGFSIETEAEFFASCLRRRSTWVFLVASQGSRVRVNGGPDLPWPGFTADELVK